ncbi:MAG: DUF1513 domain-containing protein [Pseudomonadota bacterium]
MTDRRSFLAGLFAATLCPKPTWSDAGSPAFLSAGLKPNGRYVLCGLTPDGKIAFEITLPARGHAAAAHPILAQAVAFARRPGTFALVIDCAEGRQLARLAAPEGRHFYGHGTFSRDGNLLFTTENDFEHARGIVGIWDARRNYTRIGEFASGGVGPHEIQLIPGTETLVVANGGIETHPDTGRAKLNIATMRSNLRFLGLDGPVLTEVELDANHQRNSIRHIDIAQNGMVSFGMQWQGDPSERPPVVGTYSPQGSIQMFDDTGLLAGYVGSVASNLSGSTVSATSPRSSRAFEFSTGLDFERTEIALEDICGVAALGDGFIYTSGLGTAAQTSHKIKWDNHLVGV